MSTTELKHNLLKIISAINDSATLKEIYSFVSKKQETRVKKKKDKENELSDLAEPEKKQWNELSVSNLSRAYGEDEPDYNNATIKEPNPEYRK